MAAISKNGTFARGAVATHAEDLLEELPAAALHAAPAAGIKGATAEVMLNGLLEVATSVVIVGDDDVTHLGGVKGFYLFFVVFVVLKVFFL